MLKTSSYSESTRSFHGIEHVSYAYRSPKSDDNPNSTFAFVSASGPGEEAEYLIINCKSGYYLTGNRK